MNLALLSTTSQNWPLERQTPGATGRWGDWQFISDIDAAEADAWIVTDDVASPRTVRCPRGRLILFCAEPADIHKYHPLFLAQFDKVVTCQDIQHPSIVRRQQAQPWHAGVARLPGGVNQVRLGYDQFKRNQPEKTRLISVIASTKSMCPGHRQRGLFVDALQNHFGDHIDVFGRGRRPIEDKWDAIAPYRYHLALENTATPDYWTEKLADAFLGLAHPIYFGCPNIGDYFPADALTPIDIYRPDEAIRAIETALAEERFTQTRRAVAEARAAVLDRYNFFPAAVEICRSVAPSPTEERRVWPQRNFVRLPWKYPTAAKFAWTALRAVGAR